MTTFERDPLFDPRISDWLERDPDIAPGAILETVVAALPSIPQRRVSSVPWRFRTMSMPARVAALIAVGALVIAGALAIAGIGGRHPTPSPVPSGTVGPSTVPSAAALDLSSTFQSPQYGYSIAVAPDWQVAPATLTWSGPDNNYSVDAISFPDGGGMSIGSEALLPGQTWEQWLAEFQPPDMHDNCLGAEPSTWPPIQIGNVTGAWQQMCGDHGEAVAHVGDRAYVFTYGIGDGAAPITFEQFKQILATVQFDPSAVTSPAPPPALGKDFVSGRYGYSLSYPGDATATPATASITSWAPDQAGPEVDRIADPSARLTVWSEPLEPGASYEGWTQAYCEINQNGWTPPCADAPANWREVSLASGVANLMVDGESVGTYGHSESRQFLATATAGDRVYVIQMDGDLNENLFLEVLASMRLDPTSATSTARAAGSASVPVLDAAFTSPRHGYSLRYPAGWSATASTTSWKGNAQPDADPTASDRIGTDSVQLMGTDRRLLKDQLPDAWVRLYCRSRGLTDCTDGAPPSKAFALGGAIGYMLVDGAPSPDGKRFEAVAAVPGHAWVFIFDGAIERADVDRILATVVLRPDDSVELPALTKTFTSPTYGYSVRMADSWTSSPASANDEPTDQIQMTGTDTMLYVGMESLGSRSFDAVLLRDSETTDVPAECTGGDPATWPEIQVGDRVGRLQMLCNAATAHVEVDGEVYDFGWGNSTFDIDSHMNLASWKELLKTVTFDPSKIKR